MWVWVFTDILNWKKLKESSSINSSILDKKIEAQRALPLADTTQCHVPLKCIAMNNM